MPEHAGELARYANQFEVGYNAFEFLFDFSQNYANGDLDKTAHARIVTVPAYAKVFLAVLSRTISEYEAQFGKISLPAEALGAEATRDLCGGS